MAAAKSVSDFSSGTYSSAFETGSFTTELDSDNSETEFGVNFGVGFENRLGKSAGFSLEGKYHFVFTDLIPDADSANFFTFLAGLSFRVGRQ